MSCKHVYYPLVLKVCIPLWSALHKAFLSKLSKTEFYNWNLKLSTFVTSVKYLYVQDKLLSKT